MVLTQPLKIGPVDVIGIDPKVKSILMIVHVPFPPDYAVSTYEEAIELLHEPIINAGNYLVAEGFIQPSIDKWMTHIGVIFSNPEKYE